MFHVAGKQEKSDKAFFSNVMTEYHAFNTYRGIYRGKSTKDICSLDYSSYCENKVFGNNSAVKKNAKYKKNILAGLYQISKTLSIDVKNAKIFAEGENEKRLDAIRKQQSFEEMLSKIAELQETEKQEYTTPENQATIQTAVEQLKKFKINTPLQSPKETLFSMENKEPEMVVLGSYILSIEDTATLAENIKNCTSLGISTFLGGVGVLTALFKSTPPVVSEVLALTSLVIVYPQDRLSDEEIIKAAYLGKRVRIIITDFKNFHTSDSIRIKYEIVD